MPLKWNADKVEQALDEVEKKVNEAVPVISQAVVALQAAYVPNLPEYMKQRLWLVNDELHRLNGRVRDAIANARQDLPKDRKMIDTTLNPELDPNQTKLSIF